MNVPKTIHRCNYTNGYDKTIIKLYKWMWQTYTYGGNKTIKMDGKYYINGCDQIIQMDLTKLYEWMWRRYKWM